MCQLEAESALGGKDDFFVAGEGCSGRARSRTRGSADGSTLAAAKDRAKSRTHAGAAGDGDGRTLAFAFERTAGRSGLNMMGLAVDGYRFQAHMQKSAALEVAHGLGIDYDAVRGGALMDHGLTIHGHGLGDGSGEFLAGVTIFGAQG